MTGEAPPRPAEDPPDTRIPRESYLLAASIFLFIAATNIMTPLLPDVTEDFGISILVAGVVVGSYGLARLIVDLPAGFIADRVGFRRLSRFAVVLLVASSIVGLLSPTVIVLIVARVGSGVAVGILATVILSALSSTASVENRGKVMSLFHVANNTGIALYPLIGGLIGVAIGWRATFAVTAVLAVIAGALLLPLLGRMAEPSEASKRRERVDESRIVYGRRRLMAVASIDVGVVANMFHRHGVRNTILPLYAATALGLGGITIATAIALMSVAGLLVATAGGMLGDRIGRRRVIVSGLTAVAVGNLAFLLTDDVVTFLLVSAIVGLGDFFSSSQTALLSELVPLEDRTWTLSTYRFSADLGALLGPIVLAAAMDLADASAAFVLAAFVLVTAAITTLLGVPSDRRSLVARTT